MRRRRLRVVTANVWSGLDYQGKLRMGTFESALERALRRRLLAEELRALAPDVVLLNELNPAAGQAGELAAQLGTYRCVHATGLAGLRLGRLGMPDNLQEGDGILAREELRLRPLGRRRLTGGWVFDGWSANLGNATQAIAARVEVGGRPLYLICTHWSIAADAASLAARQEGGGDAVTQQSGARAAREAAGRLRLREARRTLELIARTVPQGAPCILAGDLNTTPGSPELRALARQGLRDAFATARPGEAGATWDPARNALIRRYYGHGDARSESPAGGTGEHGGAPQRLDYILLSPGLDAGRITDARVVLDRPGRQVSDHFGVLCDLELDAG